MKARPSNTLRIIGGRWRGRKLSFPDAQGLRPTGDRIRETLFNWLQVYMPGARCLDLFAGSGALGFEAASRGAERVVMVERAPDVVDALRRNAQTLGADNIEIVSADALHYLERSGERFDVVFLDPPFRSDIIGTCCAMLEAGHWLAPEAFIYLERDCSRPAPALPAEWQLHRTRRAGQVEFQLAVRRDNTTT